MRTALKPLGQAMYVASQSDKDWIQSVQQKLYTRSKTNLDYVFDKLWGLVTDLRNLRLAAGRVARNKGHRTAGVDGITVRRVWNEGVEDFLLRLRADLRAGSYRPSPMRRVLIPKPRQPGKFRPLGIPTVRDRIVQAAMKNILEPIFEADFYPVSYGFRPGKSVHAALEHLKVLLRPKTVGKEALRRLPYQWAIEGDIRGCFDHIGHHGLMIRVRRRIGDPKVCQMIVAFLKAGVMSEAQFTRTDNGTPQGGILSPLLANIALSAIEERYERHVWPRRTPTIRTDADGIKRRANERRNTDRRRGLPVCFPIRYADDFIILVSVPPGPDQYERARDVAMTEKAALAQYLGQELGLELSETKTLITPVTSVLRFLGHHVRVLDRRQRSGEWMSASVIPKDRSQLLRHRIKGLFSRNTIGRSLGDRLQKLNPMLRGWCNFYRHAWGASRVFGAIDHYVWWTILRWLRKKHPHASMKELARRYGWRSLDRRHCGGEMGLSFHSPPLPCTSAGSGSGGRKIQASREHLRRARCTAKGARRVREGAPGVRLAQARYGAGCPRSPHGSAGEIRGALDLADAWGWQVDSTHARVLLDRELGLLWGLTRRSRAKDTARPASGASSRPR